MADNHSLRSSAHHTITRQFHSTLHILSVLISLLFPCTAFCQTDSCKYTFVQIEQSEVIKEKLNDTILNRNDNFSIIHFGDSHIQADRITSNIREAFQDVAGNGGSGMLFPYSLCGSFGPNGMESKVIGKFSYATQLKNPSNMPLGIMGYALSIQQNAQLSFAFNENFKGKISKSLTIWIHSPIDTIHITLDGAWILKERKSIGLGVYTYNYENSDAPSNCNITAQINCDFWGLQFNHSQGLSYQQNGLVGAQFTHLITHQDYVLKQLSELKPDLLIFSYGTNEAYEIIDSVSYFKKVSSFIKLVQSIVPDASILITNAPDTRSSGRKPPSQVLVNETLRKVSVQCHTAYFDLNKAMGGWGSLYSWSKKGFVLKDQLHFNKEGARILGLLMAEALFSAANLGVETTRDYMQKEISIALCKNPNDPNQNELIDSKTEKPTPQSGKKKQTEPSKNNRLYIVKKGDTLSAIAKKTNTSVATLCKKNKISQNTIIRPGQKLKY